MNCTLIHALIAAIWADLGCQKEGTKYIMCAVTLTTVKVTASILIWNVYALRVMESIHTIGIKEIPWRVMEGTRFLLFETEKNKLSPVF